MGKPEIIPGRSLLGSWKTAVTALLISAGIAHRRQTLLPHRKIGIDAIDPAVAVEILISSL
jgi:hypothetical protein